MLHSVAPKKDRAAAGRAGGSFPVFVSATALSSSHLFDLFLHHLSLPTTTAVAPGTSTEQWREVLSVIRNRLSSHEYATWFAPAEFLGAEDDVVVIRVPNAVFANHLEGEYRDRILDAFAATGIPMAAVRCSVSGDSIPAGNQPPDLADVPLRNPVRNGGLPHTISRSESLAASFTFDSFVVGSSNRCAHAAAQAVSERGVQYSPFNPLLIYGNAGLGKTHLLQAIARRYLELNPGRRILHTRGEAFSGHVVNAVRSQDLYGFRNHCAQLDMLLVDNIQFIAGLDRFGRSAEEFFHALTALSEQGRQIVLTCDSHPRDVRNLDARIKSRLESGLTTDIGKPDWEMRTAIVRSKATALAMELPDGVAETIASRYQNNVGELQGFLNSLAASSRADGVKISRVLLDRILSAHPSRRSPRPSIQDVQAAVAKAFGMAPLRLVGPQRSKALVLARHVAMYLCRETTGRTLKDIGREFRRDHSTVTYGIRRIATARERDLGLNRILERLLGQLS